MPTAPAADRTPRGRGSRVGANFHSGSVRRTALFHKAEEIRERQVQAVDVRYWLTRTDAAVAASAARLEKAMAQFRQDTAEFARDRQIYEESLRLLDQARQLSRTVIVPPISRGRQGSK